MNITTPNSDLALLMGLFPLFINATTKPLEIIKTNIQKSLA